jgi:hypothetical protein
MVKENFNRLKLNAAYELLVHADFDILLEEDINNLMWNRVALLDARVEVSEK